MPFSLALAAVKVFQAYGPVSLAVDPSSSLRRPTMLLDACNIVSLLSAGISSEIFSRNRRLPDADPSSPSSNHDEHPS